MRVDFASSAVAAATRPSEVARIDRTTAGPLARALTLLVHASSLADLLPLRSVALTRHSTEPISDYWLRAGRGLVHLRPVDASGRPIATTHTLEGLMTVDTLILLAVARIETMGATA